MANTQKVYDEDGYEVREVVCLSHHDNVKVKLVPCGTDGWFIAWCPECGKLAHNGK